MPLLTDEEMGEGFLPRQGTPDIKEPEVGMSTAAKVATVGAIGGGLLLAPGLTLGAMAIGGGGALMADPEGAGAAFRIENTIGSALASQSIAADKRIDPEFDPWADIAGSPYEEHWERFTSVGNKSHADAVKADIDRETKDRKYLEDQGALGFAQGMAAGLFDVTSLLPGGAAVRSAKGGYSTLRSAASVGAYGAAGAAITEGALQATQQTRTTGESAAAVAGSTVLSAILGAGIARRMGRAELDSLGNRLADDINRSPDDPAPAMATQPSPDRPDLDAAAAPREDVLSPEAEAVIGRHSEDTDALTQELRGIASRILPDSVKLQVVESLDAAGAKAKDDALYGIRAFHGTPHDFDQFSLDKIGTGEGAQIFGHGLYFSENKAVAAHYADALGRNDVYVDGQPFFVNGKIVKSTGSDALDRALASGDGNPRKIASDLVSMARAARASGDDARADKLMADVAEIDKFSGDIELRRASNLYEVDIDARPEQLLDWETPLTQQSPHIQAAIRKLGIEPVEYRDGSWLYRELFRRVPGDRDEVSAMLKDAGISGIRYLDEGSRDGALEPSRNIVVFDDSLVKITAKNGEPVSAAQRKEAVDAMFSVRNGGDVTQTPEFKRWFGDSKVVDESGQPLVVYHGPAQEFEAFDKSMVGSEFNQDTRGFFFTDKKATAEGYARNTSYGLPRDKTAPVVETYLSLKNPLIERTDYDPISKWDEEHADIQRRATEGGHDGIIIKADKGESLYVAFEPTQIKSVNNKGTFDPSDPNISNAMRGSVTEGKYDPAANMITIARAALDPVSTLHHEAVHALKNMGLFTPREWKALENAAKAKGWLTVPEMASYAKLYDAAKGDPRLTEEAIAMAYQRHIAGTEPQRGVIGAAMNRMKKFLDQVKSALQGKGFATPEDIFARIDSGAVAARARDADAKARGTGAARSAGAAAKDQSPMQLKSAGGLEKALAGMAPGLHLQNSPSQKVRGLANELFESALALKDHADWVVSGQLGAEAGEPGAVETRIKLWQSNLARAFVELDNAFMAYRKGSDKRRLGDLTVTSLSDAMLGSGGKLDYRQFREEVAKAMRSGDSHPIPEVAKIAKTIRREVYDPLLKRAQKLEMLPEDIAPETAMSYLNRLYNRKKIIAERDQFKSVVLNWLAETETQNAAVRGRLESLLGEQEAIAADIAKTEERVLKRAEKQKKAEAKAREKGLEPGEPDEAFILKNEEDAERIAEATARQTEVRKLIEEQVTRYQGKTSKEATSALEARRKAEEARGEGAKRLRAADKPVMEAAQKIAAQSPKERAELDDLADQIIDRVIGSPEGRLPYDAHLNKGSASGFKGVDMDLRGPMQARVFMIPDERIAPWLENDVDLLMRAYVHTMSADVELAARFGSPDMVLAFKQIQEDYNKLAQGLSPNERLKLHRRRDVDFINLAAIRDRLRGTYKLPDDPDAIHVRAVRVAMSLNYMRLLGGQTVSALPDMANLVMRNGMNVFADIFAPLVRNVSGLKAASDEAKWLSGALEMINDNRAMRLADITDPYMQGSKFERGVSAASRNFGVVSLMAPWNAVMKQIAAYSTMSRVLRNAEIIAKGRNLKPKEIAYMASLGITEGAARRIGEQFARHGVKQKGVYFANTANWDQGSRSAIEALRVALRKSADITIVTPGVAEKPKFASTLTGAMLLQFKSFSISATQRVLLANLQQRDAAVVSGAVLSLALGALVTLLKQPSDEKKRKKYGPQDWKQLLGESIDRSGMLGILSEVNAISEKATDGRIGMSALTGRAVSRYASRNLTSSLLGPSFGLAEQGIGVVNTALGRDPVTQKDLHAARQLIPFQNLIVLRKAFDATEQGLADAFGIPERARN